MEGIFLAFDHFLIWFYRLTGYAPLDFVIGTLVLAVICVLIGEVTVYLIFLFLRRHIDEKAEEAAKYQELSMDALKAGDKEAYKAANTLANDAFGHSFFQQLALSAAFFWPVCFALAWMQERFLDIEVPIPGTNISIGFIGSFILLYIIALLLIKKAKRQFPRLRRHGVRDASMSSPDLPKAG